MPPDWKRIRDARSDITDWVIHWTTTKTVGGKYKMAMQVLQSILQCGYLKPTLAPRPLYTGYPLMTEEKPTIQGDYPAVCFTDQSLVAFIQSYKTLSRYNPHAIAFKKSDLYIYGGRPVIYSDKEMLDRLKEQDKYLWVHYRPFPEEYFSKYPIDWTSGRARTRSWFALGTLGTGERRSRTGGLRGYPETFLHCCNEIKQHPCGNETRGDRRERVC